MITLETVDDKDQNNPSALNPLKVKEKFRIKQGDIQLHLA